MHSSQAIVDFLSCLEPVACLCVFFFIQRRRLLGPYRFLSTYLVVRAASFVALYPLLHSHGLFSAAVAYEIYFYCYWSTYAVEAVLGFLIVFSIYNLAMAPLKGLQRLGMLMFRWAAGIAVVIALTVALGPHTSNSRFVMKAVTQLQQTQSILTLCMLLFVCFAIRPMGLSFRSKIFGVSLGLGMLATADLVGSAWLSLGMHISSTYNILNGFVLIAAFSTWAAYFSVPEPKRRMIILPTTSPFLRWNQISIALGDEPGFVALGEVHPDMFAPAEVEIMRRASLKISAAAMST